MKKIIFSLLFVALLWTACSGPETDSVEIDSKVSEFIWKGDSLGSIYYSYASILLPVEFDQATSRKTYLNLQPGVNHSLIYADFASELGMSGDDSVNDLAGKIGEIDFLSESMPVVNRQYSQSDSVVGSLSMDFFKGKNVIIDFPEKTIQVADRFDLPEAYEPVEYQVYLENKILVPVKMGEEELLFLYNPQSPLFVIFNRLNPGEIQFGNMSYPAPEVQTVEDANPAFDGILGYAFLKDKQVWMNPDLKQVCIFQDIAK